MNFINKYYLNKSFCQVKDVTDMRANEQCSVLENCSLAMLGSDLRKIGREPFINSI